MYTGCPGMFAGIGVVKYGGGAVETFEPRKPWRNSRISSQQSPGTKHGR